MNHRPRKQSIRERVFKWIFLAGDSYKLIVSALRSVSRFVITITFSLFVLGLIFYIGFGNTPGNLEGLKSAFRWMFLVIFLTKSIPEISKFRKERGVALVLHLLVFVFSLGVFLSNFNVINFSTPLHDIFSGNTPVVMALLIIGLTEISGLHRMLSSVKIPPGLIFSASFMVIIFIGSGLLMMPKAHTGHLTWLDSLFTSVSAVCVTGLVVVDTATAFTTLGKIIIISLIQIGGLGIMTFTGFFSYVFTSGSSFRDNLLLKELFSAETMNNLLKLLTKIILLTFLIEGIGVLAIYSSLDHGQSDKILFSVFHSVSAFCNAGFSTMPGNLYDPGIRYNSTLQISVALLIILGGIGFPVLVGLYANIKHFIRVVIRKFQGKLKPIVPVQKNIATRIVVYTTALLIIGGTGLYFLFESDNSMKDLGTVQKIITSFFGSVSARTAGFNMSDLTKWSYPTVYLMMVLMWIGASPGSTGGGIKTTTFALAFRTSWKYITGRERIRIGNREISENTIAKVLSVIFLSLTLIGSGFLVLLLTEKGKEPSGLLFECFSAYGTVGLSLTDSATLTSSGKIVDILLMFIGRVGPLTLLTGFLASPGVIYSRYPEIEIVIN